MRLLALATRVRPPGKAWASPRPFWTANHPQIHVPFLKGAGRFIEYQALGKVEGFLGDVGPGLLDDVPAEPSGQPD